MVGGAVTDVALLFLLFTLGITFLCAAIIWHAKRKVMRDSREANAFLRDMGAPTGLKVVRKVARKK